MRSVLRRLIIIFSCIVLLCAIIIGAALTGFLTAKFENGYANRLFVRVERKIAEVRGTPDMADRRLARIESTFISFDGTVYKTPKENWVSGGGLAVLGSDLIVVDSQGEFMLYRDGFGIMSTNIETPENGKAAYVRLSQNPEHADLNHQPWSVRYNDVIAVERGNSTIIILSYTFFDEVRVCYGNRLVKISLPSTSDLSAITVAAEEWELLFDSTPCLAFRNTDTALVGIQAGGRMALAPDGRLLLTMGDYAFDGLMVPEVGLMEPSVDYGKVLSIDIDSGDKRVVSVGHRNPQGIAVAKDGQIWSVEHGARGGDELNLIVEGANYGWPKESLGTLYNGQPFPFDGPQGRHDTYQAPSFAWLPSIGTSSIAAIDGFHESWDGGLVVGGLSQPNIGQALYHIRTEGENVIFTERIDIQRRVRYVVQYGDRLAVWLDPSDLLILEKAERENPFALAISYIDQAEDNASADEAKAILGTCNQCHSFRQDDHQRAPSMHRVVGRRVASTAYSGYSDALRSVGGVWSRDRLREFLTDPQKFAPGTQMPAQGLKNGPALDLVIEALAEYPPRGTL